MTSSRRCWPNRWLTTAPWRRSISTARLDFPAGGRRPGGRTRTLSRLAATCSSSPAAQVRWTPRLLRYAASVTAVDASPEMLALARERVGDDDRVRFVCADLFGVAPRTALRRRLLRVLALRTCPLERFAAFWALVADCLTPERPGFLRRRRLSDAGRAHRRRGVGDHPPPAKRRHHLPSRQGSSHADWTRTAPCWARLEHPGPAGPRAHSSGGPADGRSGRSAPQPTLSEDHESQPANPG